MINKGTRWYNRSRRVREREREEKRVRGRKGQK